MFGSRPSVATPSRRAANSWRRKSTASVWRVFCLAKRVAAKTFFYQRKNYIISKFFLRLYYIKVEYIIKIHTTLSNYSHTEQLQISIPNLCKKSNRRSHRHTLSKQAENKHPKNGDQHPCRLERAQSSSSFLRLSSSSFCHR